MKQMLKQLLRENFEFGDITPNYLINRIPFLKDYELFTHQPIRSQPINFKLDKNVGTENVMLKNGDDIIKIPLISLHSECGYYKNVGFYDNKPSGGSHEFYLKNNIYFRAPEDMSSLEAMSYRMIYKHIGENFSYSDTLYFKDSEIITKEELDRVINEINRKFFAFEEFSEKHNLLFF